MRWAPHRLGFQKRTGELLGRAVALDPGHVNAQVALGVAALRSQDPVGAQAPLEQAMALEPSNPYAQRALGQIHLMRDDPTTLYTLAQCLMALRPTADLAERLKQSHSRLALQVLRANASDGPRMDVVMVCASALERPTAPWMPQARSSS